MADDDPYSVDLIRQALEEEGYIVAGGFDGQYAIRTALRDQPDLIVIDINMPLYNGFKALEAIRHWPSTKEIPVILVTDEDYGGALERIVSETPRVAYLRKPVDLEQLVDLARLLLGQYSPGSIDVPPVSASTTPTVIA